MKTLLSEFCGEFEAAIRPLLAPLEELAASLSRGAQEQSLPPAAREPVSGFSEASHQLGALAEKVAEQQAYVLIFGPLKSGKSTLINSIGATYVSEVTALPAYPCMVYVSHAEALEYVVTRYDGTQQRFASPAAMRMQVTRDHGELADRLREVERSGREFDPAVDHPTAIRRIDVKVPAPELESSGAVLVDTPGLYSKMKFGYDRMTREFRDSAACAIFVVKTDNLFLEQVFAEFTELLELFSKIFLVVNLDTTKMDLKPDGSLAPSLEREDPIRIVEAFETLAMSDALKRAVDEGRLKLYPVDLLRAASARLTGDDELLAQQQDFSAFQSDLSNYLDSTDYLLAFLTDSLRHADTLVRESERLCRHPALRALTEELSQLRGQSEQVEQRLGRIETLTQVEWTERFSPLKESLRVEAAGDADRRRATQARELEGALATWLRSDESVQVFLDSRLRPSLHQLEVDLATNLERALRDAVSGNVSGGESGVGHAGASIDEATAQQLGELGIDLGALAGQGLISILPRAYATDAKVRLDLAELPVKKTLLDWLFFRGQQRLRKNLLGDESRPTRPITPYEKQKRLVPAGQEYLGGQLRLMSTARADRAARELPDRVFNEYVDVVQTALTAQLAEQRQIAQGQLDELRARMDRLEDLCSRLQQMEALLGSAGQQLEDLTERYAEADAFELAAELRPHEAASDLAPGTHALPGTDSPASAPKSNSSALDPELDPKPVREIELD